LREVASNVPPALDWAVRKCLAIDRRKRTGSATELISMLKTVPAHFGGLGKYPTRKNAAKNLIGIAKRAVGPMAAIFSRIRPDRNDAANALNRIIQLKGGKKTLKKAQMKILLEICRQMKKGPAPAPLLDLTAFALFADGRRLVRSWITDTNHWMRWNAVEVLKMSNMEVDMVPVYIQDLSFAGSVPARIAAVDRLGEIGDKRAIPSLKKVKELDQNDPLVSMEAGKVLDEKFK